MFYYFYRQRQVPNLELVKNDKWFLRPFFSPLVSKRPPMMIMFDKVDQCERSCLHIMIIHRLKHNYCRGLLRLSCPSSPWARKFNSHLIRITFFCEKKNISYLRHIFFSSKNSHSFQIFHSGHSHIWLIYTVNTLYLLPNWNVTRYVFQQADFMAWSC